MSSNSRFSTEELRESLRLARTLLDITEQHLLLIKPSILEVDAREYFASALAIARFERKELDMLWYLMGHASKAIGSAIDDTMFGGLADIE